MLSAYIAGFSLSFSLILAIGSQNAFVLKQGLKNQYIFVVCTVCAISDALLIALGVAGFGSVVQQYPIIETVARYVGAGFLGVYAILSIKSALTVEHALSTQQSPNTSLKRALVLCLAFTWLNPHVYLDTLFLLGSISTQYQPDHLWFAIGASNASLLFFYSLGYGARRLAPWFQLPKAWKILEFTIGIVMMVIAISLLISA